MTIIISGFPGVGKTEFFKSQQILKEYKVLDSDSSNFSWLKFDGKKIRNPDFPQNYINHIKENLGEYHYILVSSHGKVRDALYNNELPFVLVYPLDNIKTRYNYLQRYKKRGNDKAFIEFIKNGWFDFIEEMREQKGCIHVQFKMTTENLSDYIW